MAGRPIEHANHARIDQVVFQLLDITRNRIQNANACQGLIKRMRKASNENAT